MVGDDDYIKPAPRFTPLVLERIGIDELERYIVELRAEIARTEAEIEKKRQARSGADSFFNFSKE